MKKKYEILNFNLKELDLLERHLNKMANNHWHLKWISNYVICYEYNEDEIHYYIDYNQYSFYDKNKEENRLEEQKQMNFYNDLGYEFLCSFDHYVIYKSEEQLEEIHTNEEIENELFTYVQKRTNQYNIYLLLGHILFMLVTLWFYEREFVLGFLDFSWFIYSLSLFITIYFTIHENSCKRQIELKDIKRRTIVNLVLKFTQCVLGYIFVLYSGSKLSTLWLLIAYYCVHNFSNLLYFNSVDKKYKYVPFITNHLPRLIVAAILIISVLKQEYIDIYSPYNENYPQTIINTEFFINDPHVEHYNEDESIALHMIECRVVNYDEEESINLYYYQDKTHILRSFILKMFTYNTTYSKTEYIDTIDDVEIRSIHRDTLDVVYEQSDIILIKDSQYVRVRLYEDFDKENIQTLINAINWK